MSMRFAVRLLLVFLCGLWASGCGEPKADVALPKRYAKDGIKFQHPGNWKITEELKEEGVYRSVTVGSPGDAVVVVQVFDAKNVLPLKEYAELFSQETAKAMPMGKILPPTVTLLEAKDGWERLRETFVIRLVGVDVPHTRLVQGRDIGPWRCYVLCQVADEDMKAVEVGFQQILDSMELE